MTNQIIDISTGEIIESDNIVLEINREHQLFLDSVNNSLQHAIRCGELLIQQKKQLSHGEWLPWVMINCDFSKDKAERYMRIANSATSPNLGEAKTFYSALKLLQEEKRAERKTEPVEKNILFSWFNDESYLAMEQGIEALKHGVNVLIGANADPGVARHILRMTRGMLQAICDQITKAMGDD